MYRSIIIALITSALITACGGGSIEMASKTQDSPSIDPYHEPVDLVSTLEEFREDTVYNDLLANLEDDENGTWGRDFYWDEDNIGRDQYGNDVPDTISGHFTLTDSWSGVTCQMDEADEFCNHEFYDGIELIIAEITFEHIPGEMTCTMTDGTGTHYDVHVRIVADCATLAWKTEHLIEGTIYEVSHFMGVYHLGSEDTKVDSAAIITDKIGDGYYDLGEWVYRYGAELIPLG